MLSDTSTSPTGVCRRRKEPDMLKRLTSVAIATVVLLLILQNNRSTASTAATVQQPAASANPVQYKLLATNKTSSMQKEMSEAALAGFRFDGVMGGETSFGGKEVVIIMSRQLGVPADPRFQYKLLATSKTSTMQKELQQAGDAGFEYKGQTVYESTFGGKEVMVILERDRDNPKPRYVYRLLATKKTSTMQKELAAAGEDGFRFVGVT